MNEKITLLRAESKENKICFFFYFSGHGCTFVESNMLTYMVMLTEDDGYLAIEEKLRRLSRKSNVVVIVWLDSCRTIVNTKSKVENKVVDFG
jgi:hypothetical protein